MQSKSICFRASNDSSVKIERLWNNALDTLARDVEFQIGIDGIYAAAFFEDGCHVAKLRVDSGLLIAEFDAANTAVFGVTPLDGAAWCGVGSSSTVSVAIPCSGPNAVETLKDILSGWDYEIVKG